MREREKSLQHKSRWMLNGDVTFITYGTHTAWKVKFYDKFHMLKENIFLHVQFELVNSLFFVFLYFHSSINRLSIV